MAEIWAIMNIVTSCFLSWLVNCRVSDELRLRTKRTHLFIPYLCYYRPIKKRASRGPLFITIFLVISLLIVAILWKVIWHKFFYFHIISHYSLLLLLIANSVKSTFSHTKENIALVSYKLWRSLTYLLWSKTETCDLTWFLLPFVSSVRLNELLHSSEKEWAPKWANNFSKMLGFSNIPCNSFFGFSIGE